MPNIVISVENLSKTYRLGQIGTGTFSRDLAIWWAKALGKPNPYLKIGETDHGNRDGEELWALRDISFTVKQGEVLGIIGKNGAGKSTLLKILSRVTAPTSGVIKVKGRIASLLEVGTGFHPELTGRENVYLNGTILGMRKVEIDRKFDEIVDFAGIEKFIDTPVKRYSSGMYVRLAFSVAAHLDSELLIVDEVLAVGDIGFQKKCLGKMGDVASSEGRTVLFVSHNMMAVQNLCSRSLWIESGKIRLIGYSHNVIDEYTHSNTSLGNTKNSEGWATIGDGSVKFLSYEVRNTDYENKILKTNEDVYIHIKLQIKEDIKQPACGIRITNEYGIKLTSINTVEQGLGLPEFKAGVLSISIKLNRVSYLPGNYYATFWVMNPQGHIYLDVEDVIQFNISQSNIYGNSLVDHRWGVVYTMVDFVINPNDL